MPVPPAQLAILASLEEPKSIQAIVDENALPYQTVYTAAKKLETEGILTSHKEGKQRIFSVASPSLPGLARTLLFEQSREDWDQVFHGDRPMLLHVLDRVGRPSLVAKVMDKSQRAIHHAIQTHAPRGLLVKEDNDYRINPHLSALGDLLERLAELRAHKTLQTIAPEARMLWSLGPEVLFRTDEAPTEEETVHAGGLSRFARYGIELMMPQASYYYRSHRELDVSDAILQALVADLESKRTRSYAALLYEKETPSNLRFQAHLYGLEEEAQALIRYVETHEADDGFFPWDEHNRFREQYGVGDQ